MTDRETGKPKGYGFCEYADGATALSAMRNLNGFEINGRNLRVDFADGGDKSNNNSNGGGGGGGGGGGYGGDKHSSGGSVSGEAIIQAIEGAISRFGPLKLYDMLVSLKEHARQRPDHTKSMFAANPALTHAIVQCFKTLQIPIPSSTELQPALLAPPQHLHGPPHYGRPLAPPPQRSPLPNSGPVGGGILGMAPPMGMGMGMAPPGSAPSAGPPKPAGSRWSARPGPVGGMMPPPMASGPPGQQPPQQSAPSVYQGPPPPLMQQPPPMSRDPRRARDPRLAKRPLGMEQQQPPPMHAADLKRARLDEPSHASGGQGNGTFDAIAELARDMTPQKLNMLPPSERQMLVTYMQQHGMPFSG